MSFNLRYKSWYENQDNNLMMLFGWKDGKQDKNNTNTFDRLDCLVDKKHFFLFNYKNLYNSII